MKVKLYVEGGGEGKELAGRFREGWHRFFEKAGLGGRMPGIVRGGSREKTLDLFKNAASTPKPGEFPILLVDSEVAVPPDRAPWAQLRAADGWEPPPGVGEDQAFLMVQVMETWLLADREALERFFGEDWQDAKLPKWPQLETVPKKTILDALDHLSARGRRRYSKGKVSFDLLGRIDPGKVEAKCPHAKALLDFLRGPRT